MHHNIEAGLIAGSEGPSIITPYTELLYNNNVLDAGPNTINYTLLGSGVFVPDIGGNPLAALSFDGLGDMVVSDIMPTWGGLATKATMRGILRVQPGDDNVAVCSLGQTDLANEMLVYVLGGKLTLFNHSSSGNFTFQQSLTTVNNGAPYKWHAVIEGLNLYMYLAGLLDNGASGSSGSPVPIVDSGTRRLVTGMRASGAVNSENLQGIQDENKYYNLAFTAAQVAADAATM